MKRYLGILSAVVFSLPASDAALAQETITWGIGMSTTPVTIRAGQNVTWNGSFASHPLAESNANFPPRRRC